ncbi:MAG TPA: hypothetical protein DDZ51_16400 [Planctomycetaceae bacterium]|nr:hypothetical protein [Planctomycetaceae bacterium]
MTFAQNGSARLRIEINAGTAVTSARRWSFQDFGCLGCVVGTKRERRFSCELTETQRHAA